MPREPIHPTATEMEKHKQLDHEIQEMIASLNNRLADLQHIHISSSHGQAHAHTDSSHLHHHLGHHDINDHHGGLGVITLAGSNQGATMHGDEKLAFLDDHADPYNEAFGTYVNSNFQAINNSIFIEGCYTTNDPGGVHVEISDLIGHEHHHHGQNHDGDNKKGKKKIKKDKENGKSQQHHSDKSD